MLYKLTKKRNGSHAYCKPGKLAGISISHLKKFLIDSKRFVYLRQRVKGGKIISGIGKTIWKKFGKWI